MPDSQRYPLNIYLVNNVKDMVVFHGNITPMSSCASHVCIKKKQLIFFLNFKHCCLIYILSDKVLKGAVVNAVLPSLLWKVFGNYAYSPFNANTQFNH